MRRFETEVRDEEKPSGLVSASLSILDNSYNREPGLKDLVATIRGAVRSGARRSRHRSARRARRRPINGAKSPPSRLTINQDLPIIPRSDRRLPKARRQSNDLRSRRLTSEEITRSRWVKIQALKSSVMPNSTTRLTKSLLNR